MIFKELYEYREMICSLVKRDIRGRYKGSVLGFLWTFLNPLLQLVVYTLVFSVIMRSGINKYYIFLFVALIPWIFFSTSISGGASCIITQKEMVQKIYFPREVLPISHVTSQFVNMLYGFVVVLAVLIFTGYGVNCVALLYLPVIMSIEYILALGLVMIVSAVTVYLKDIQYVINIIMMLWQFLTPIMYSEKMVPQQLLFVFRLNPMTSVIKAYRTILYYKAIPDITMLGSTLIIGIIFLVGGWAIFLHLKRRFAENL